MSVSPKCGNPGSNLITVPRYPVTRQCQEKQSKIPHVMSLMAVSVHTPCTQKPAQGIISISSEAALAWVTFHSSEASV